MSKLKPCPFCGCDKIRFVERFHINGGSYDCVECGCSTEYKQTQEQALAVWNTRAESLELATLREQVKVLREACQEAEAVICSLCVCINPQHANCTWCHDIELYRAALEQTKPKDGK